MGTPVNPFMSTLTAADLLDIYATMIVGQFVGLGRYTVPAGVAIALGYGDLAGQMNAVGRFYADIKDDTAAPVNEDGLLRLMLHNPQDRPVRVLGEWRTNALRTSATDRRQQFPMPESDVQFGEDWSLVLEMKGDAVDTVHILNSVLFLDITTWDVV